MGRRNDCDRPSRPDPISIELLGTGTRTSAGHSEVPHRQQRVGRSPRRSSTIVAVAAVAALIFVVAGRPTPVEDADVLPETDRPAVVTDPELRATGEPPVAERSEARPSAPQVARPEPVAPEAQGIVLIAGRGLEKVFIDLGTGERRVVDVAGIPVASVDGFVALAPKGEDTSSDLCWFDLERRQCQYTPPTLGQLIKGAFPDSVEGAGVDLGSPEGSSLDDGLDLEDGIDAVELGLVQSLDVDAVLELRAVSLDARWSAMWVGGQLVVTDQRSGEEYKVPGVSRTYFEDGLALVG